MATHSTAAKRGVPTGNLLPVGPAGPWHLGAPRRIRNSYASDADQRGWHQWCRHLAKRKWRPVAELLGTTSSPLTWALAEEEGLSDTLNLVARLADCHAARSKEGRKIAGVLAEWLESSERARPETALGLQCLAWCDSLPRLVDHVPAGDWWLTVNRLIRLAATDRSATTDPLAAQLLWGELRLALGHAFGELQSCRDLAESGRRAIVRGFHQLLDPQGAPNSRHLHLLRPLLASWTRSRALARAIWGDAWEESINVQYAGLVRCALGLTRADGRQTFSGPPSSRWSNGLLKAAQRQTDDRTTRRVLRWYRASGRRSSPAAPKMPGRPSFEGSTAGLALLRANWQGAAPSLAVTYNGKEVATELNVGKRTLWSGLWEFEVRFDGQPLAPQSEWEQVSWESDKHADNLEIETRLSHEVILQRQMLLLREDRCLVLADAIMATRPASIEYRATLPLGDWSSFSGETCTREGVLTSGRRARARVLPLSLGEWRSGLPDGHLETRGTSLQLVQQAHGSGLFAALFIDLAPNRLEKPVTWRQLTVGQHRRVVASDQAVGYRVQVGKLQWLIYRSLAPAEIRTVLGQNLKCEFMAARFHGDCPVEPLMEIE